MAMIIEEKYSKLGSSWRKKFLFNRVLRLLPMNIVTVVITLAVFGGFSRFHFPEDGLLFISWIWVNFLILGQDLLVVLNAAELIKVPFGYFVVPQAWSIGVEIIFYIFIATWTFHSFKAYAALAIIFGFIRFICYSVFGSSDTWVYYFFPSVMVFFFIGACSYKFYKIIQPFLPGSVDFSQHFIIATAVYSVGFLLVAHATNLYEPLDTVRMWVIYCGLFFALPLWWHITHKSSFDLLCGNFPYPVYLIHFFVLGLKNMYIPEASQTVKVVILVSVFVAATLLIWTDMPFESIRKKYFKKLKMSLNLFMN